MRCQFEGLPSEVPEPRCTGAATHRVQVHDSYGSRNWRLCDQHLPDVVLYVELRPHVSLIVDMIDGEGLYLRNVRHTRWD